MASSSGTVIRNGTGKDDAAMQLILDEEARDIGYDHDDTLSRYWPAHYWRGELVQTATDLLAHHWATVTRVADELQRNGKGRLTNL